MSDVVRIRRSVRAGNLQNGWVRVILCSAVALVVAVGLLDGAAQGWVGMLSVVVALFAACRLLDSDEVRRIEQVAPSTFNETTMPGSRYITSTGTPRPVAPAGRSRRTRLCPGSRRSRGRPATPSSTR